MIRVKYVVGRTTGLTGEQVRNMTLARYAGTALDPLPQHDPEGHGALARWRYRQRMVLRQRSNVCPPTNRTPHPPAGL
ncbi:hypothetical protein Sfulv_23680 [Streptomyces fulvorobeus]|uniref:Uncharacterized protein n=1 Tax=Streptomyces fulvorobeus TaxID=284028 RepID=A0A7J0C5Y2_9ACTN|nr:hypothetical protein Sfulv_23680 [Streptomyces fulvorobeus]